MEWSLESIINHINVYNRKYFDNKIKQPIEVEWSRDLYTNDDSEAVTQKLRGKHKIIFNVKLATASREIMRNTIAHEMIHCLQDEIDRTWKKTYKEDEGHNRFFLKWCAKLNKEHHFRFPLQQYVSTRESKSHIKNSTGVYYVYQNLEYQNGTIIPCGVFVKFLFSNEIANLRSHGLTVTYFNAIKFTEKVRFVVLKNQTLTGGSYKMSQKDWDINTFNHNTKLEREWCTNYDDIKDITVSPDTIDFEDALKQNGLRGRMFYGDEFNFDDARNVTEALELLLLNDYIIE